MSDDRHRLAADGWGSLLRVHAALVPLLDRELRRRSELPLAWYDIVLELEHAPGRRLRMSDLAERVTLSRTRVSRLVVEMAEAGLLHREEDPTDGRSTFAVLTDTGRGAFRRAARPYLAAIEEHFAQTLTDQELRQLTEALEKVLGAVTPTIAT